MTYKSYRQLPGALWRLRRGLPLLLPLLLSTPPPGGPPRATRRGGYAEAVYGQG